MILVLDTETFGLTNLLVYNVGWIVYDPTTQMVVDQRDYLTSQFWHDKALMHTAYYSDKMPIYEERIKNKLNKVVGWRAIMNYLKKTIARYNITTIYAYNSKFDMRSISQTCDFFKIENPVPVIEDIMDYIGVITDTPDYKEFCEKFGFMTKHKTPRPQKKAETLQRYLTDNPDYEEEHTALEDSKIELYILTKALDLMV